MNKNGIIARLNTPAFRLKLKTNTEAIISRIRADGFFAESLTGTYRGMFPRTLGGLARLLSVTGELNRLEPSLDYCLDAMTQFDSATVPHVIGDRDPQSGAIRFIDTIDQIDGQAHFILAWAICASGNPGSAFENRSYERVATLLDRTTSGPWLCFSTLWRIEPGLVLNTHLEHSREDQYWHAYDFLSQAFVAAVLERMIPIASRRNDGRRVALWTERLAALEKNIATNLTCERDGTTVYLEMLLPTGREPLPFDGLGWINLASVASGWTGVDRRILRQTIRLWHKLATVEINGVRLTSCDWPLTNGRIETYGKMLAWDFLFCLQEEWYDDAAMILDFIETMDSGELFTERFRYDPTASRWETQDAGNGEQCVWMCWGFLEAMRMVGLS